MSDINEVMDRCVFILKKPKRQGDGARISGFGIIITKTRGHVLSPEIGSADMGWEVGRSRRKALKIVCEAALARVFLGRNWPVYLDIVI